MVEYRNKKKKRAKGRRQRKSILMKKMRKSLKKRGRIVRRVSAVQCYRKLRSGGLSKGVQKQICSVIKRC